MVIFVHPEIATGKKKLPHYDCYPLTAVASPQVKFDANNSADSSPPCEN